ncbi:MAG: hypothetical protein WB609_09260 [Candidatus Cybelea sp.]
MRTFSPILRAALTGAALLLSASCSAGTTPLVATPAAPQQAAFRPPTSFKEPAIIAFNTQNGSLEFWPMQHNGDRTLQPLSGPLGINQGYSLAADGNVVVIANYSPPEVVTYDIKTKAEKTMADPYGSPYDIAVDKKGDFYALNAASVAVYKHGSSQPSELTCPQVTIGEGIAVDNEGDVYVNGYGKSFMGVVEYRAGSTKCSALHLRTERGYIGGIGVDPKTDDLIVIDDPDSCAGGIEGRMVIYPKPYEQRTSVRRVLNASYCSGQLRLDANSSHVLYADATVSAGFPLVDQARYPSGKYEDNTQTATTPTGTSPASRRCRTRSRTKTPLKSST